MKLPITCPQCLEEQIAGAHKYTVIEIRDDGRYESTCDFGHVTTTFLQQLKFEVLFEIGSYAIIDGYYREAASSYTSSLERFYEFFIKVLCLSKGMEWESILTTWRDVSSQSERQLGAFIFLYYSEFGDKPELLSRKSVEFRNSVIHKGKIPSREEALNYGQEVLNIVSPIIKILKEDYYESIQKVILHHQQQAAKPADKDLRTLFLSIKTIISLLFHLTELESRSLEVEIDNLRKI